MSDSNINATAAPVISSGRRELQLVTFRIGDHEYGADVADVKGIYHGLPMIPTPDAPDVIAGDVHISGERVPVINLPRLFGNKSAERSSDWWIIVLTLLGGPIGLIVERVTEVVHLEPNALREKSDVRHPANDYVIAHAHHQHRVIALMDFTRMIQDQLQ